MPISNPPISSSHSIWCPVTDATGGGMGEYNNIPCATLSGAGNYCNISFTIPAGFNSLESAYVYAITLQNQAGTDVDVFSCYASDNEAYNTHTESKTDYNYTFVHLDTLAIDVSPVLSNLNAGDSGGIEVELNAVAGAEQLKVIGLLITYS